MGTTPTYPEYLVYVYPGLPKTLATDKVDNCAPASTSGSC